MHDAFREIPDTLKNDEDFQCDVDFAKECFWPNMWDPNTFDQASRDEMQKFIKQFAFLDPALVIKLQALEVQHVTSLIYGKKTKELVDTFKTFNNLNDVLVAVRLKWDKL